MKKLFSILLAFFATLTVGAAEVINLGALELDTDYALTVFKGYKATFTPTKSGVLTFSSTTTDDLAPYSDEACTKSVDVTKNSNYGPHTYDMNVVEGTTYYFYEDFIMNSNTVIRLSMADSQELTLEGSFPEIGGVFNVSDGGQISFSFNKAVSFTSSSITVAGKTQKIVSRVSESSIFTNDAKDIIWNALTAGTVKAGDEFTITITGICMTSNNSILYNGTGTLEAKFVVGKMPIVLESTENTTGTFLSYYTSTNEAGIVKLHFSGKVGAEKLSAMIKYGNIDEDASGEYYVEYLTPTVGEDGKTVIVNLQGKRRRAIDMVASGNDYGEIELGITGVTDEDGNYAYAAGSGSLGSYWFEFAYKEVSANVVAEFTPANGADLEKYSNLEIWVTDEDKLSYDGVQFDYEVNGEHKTTLVANSDIKKEKDPEDATAKILTIAIPSEVKTAKNVEVSFANLQCADGSDYSSVLRAKYNAFVISRTSPVAGSTMEWLNEGQQVKIYTNKDEALTNVRVALHDLNPAEGDKEVLFEATAEPLEGGKGFAYTCDRNYRLERGHDYSLEITGMKDNEAVGSDYVVYHGAADAFRYSDVQLETITPEPGVATLTQNADNDITLTFDGMVILKLEDNYIVAENNIAIDAIQGVDANEDGYANVWVLTVKGETIPTIGEQVNLHILATDMDDRHVQGNTDYKDYNYLRLTYATDYVDAVQAISSNRSEGIYNIYYNVYGQKVGGDYKGIVIGNGKKTIRK